jgi:nitrogen-specific signal transduction histidine kinase
MANRHFLDSHGCSESEVLGRSYECVTDYRCDEVGSCPVDQILANRRPLAVLNQMEDDSGPHWFERHLSPILDNDGNVEFVIEAVRDVTDQRLLEKEKMERVKLEGVVEMAGTAAHELNSPLFAALGTAQLLHDDLSDPEIHEELAMIIRNLKRMAELTKKMARVTGFESREYVGDTRIFTLKTKEE